MYVRNFLALWSILASYHVSRVYGEKKLGAVGLGINTKV